MVKGAVRCHTDDQHLILQFVSKLLDEAVEHLAIDTIFHFSKSPRNIDSINSILVNELTNVFDYDASDNGLSDDESPTISRFVFTNRDDEEGFLACLPSVESVKSRFQGGGNSEGTSELETSISKLYDVCKAICQAYLKTSGAQDDMRTPVGLESSKVKLEGIVNVEATHSSASCVSSLFSLQSALEFVSNVLVDGEDSFMANSILVISKKTGQSNTSKSVGRNPFQFPFE